MLNREIISTLLLPFLALIVGCAHTSTSTIELSKRLELARTYSNSTSGDALLIWIDEERVVEDFAPGYAPDQPHVIMEASLLLVGIGALAAQGDGLIDLDDRVSDTLTEFAADSVLSRITISNLLDMKSGLDSTMDGLVQVPTFGRAQQLARLNQHRVNFGYGPNAYQVFGALMNRKVGAFTWLKENLFEPLAIPGGRWFAVTDVSSENASVDPGSLSPRLFDGANLTASELERIGQLILNKGNWHGEQIFPSARELTEPSSTSGRFRLGAWVNMRMTDQDDLHDMGFEGLLPEGVIRTYSEEKLLCDTAPDDLLAAAGRFGQRLYVVPSMNMVIVRLGRENRAWSDTVFLSLLFSGEVPTPPGE